MRLNTRIIWTLTVSLLFVPATPSRAVSEETDLPFESDLLERVQSLSLSEEQQAAIDQLVGELGPMMARAEREAARTDAQRQARTAALHEAQQRGLRGLAAKEFIAEAGALSDEQIRAAANAAKLRYGFNEEIRALLSPEQQTALASAEGLPGEATGSIIVRLSADLPKPSNDAKTLLDVAKELQLDALAETLLEFRLTESERVITAFDEPIALGSPPTEAQTTLIDRLRSYWRIDGRHHADDLDRIISRLSKLPEIDTAYAEQEFVEPAVNPFDDPYCARQEYLNAKPRGIDARYAWTRHNGEGASVGLVDMERGWHQHHEDLRGKSPQVLLGDERPQSRPHGTAVLGEVIAEDNTIGVVGIAPSASYVFMVSYYESVTRGSVSVADTICRTLPFMYPGDVLLLEVQLKRPVTPGGKERYLPAEVDDAVFDAIQLAVSANIVVVAAAGNGRQDLDKYVSPSGKNVLNRNLPGEFRDSGAILVGASDAGPDHNRHQQSNYGSRIDCFAWGSRVTTTGHNGSLSSGGGDPNAYYTKSFNGTSSAAPIVAGAAMILQGMSKGNSARVLSPSEVRALLANPLTGTPQGHGTPGHIGVMPNLRAIIEHQCDFQSSGCVPACWLYGTGGRARSLPARRIRPRRHQTQFSSFSRIRRVRCR